MSESSPQQIEPPAYAGQFRACYADEAVASTGRQNLDLIVETHYRADEGMELFTVYEGIEYRSGSLNGLVSTLPGVQELRISRTVPLELDGLPARGRLTEIYRPSSTANRFEDTTKVVLEIGSTIFESPWTDFVGVHFLICTARMSVGAFEHA